jgi:hypothetical protein
MGVAATPGRRNLIIFWLVLIGVPILAYVIISLAIAVSFSVI